MNPLAKLRATAAVLWCAALLTCRPVARADDAPPSSALAARIDPTVTYGIWEGWGTSLAWWAKVFGNRDDLADLFFTTRTVELSGQSLPGLGLNIVRYNAGACAWNEVDGRRMAVSKIILPYRQIEGFWLDGKSRDPAAGGWNWDVDANQRAMLLKARERGANQLELFSNSPMWWMCANSNPSGAVKADDDNLAPAHYADFAGYLAAIARQAKDRWGAAFTSVEPFNEPVSGWWSADCKQEGCHFSREAQAAILKLLRAELDRRGLADLAVAASDENTYEQALGSWKSYDAPTRAAVSRINVHGYQGKSGPRSPLHEAALAGGKRLWNSEYGEGDGTGLTLAHCLNLDLHTLHPTAWCYWQTLDGGGWGLIQASPNKQFIGPVNPKYFVLAQYTRHIRAGMWLLESEAADTVAAYDGTARKLVLVTFNEGPARAIRYDLSRFDGVAGLATRWITEPSGASRHEAHRDVQVRGGSFSCAFPANSVQIIEVENMRLSDGPRR